MIPKAEVHRRPLRALCALTAAGIGAGLALAPTGPLFTRAAAATSSSSGRSPLRLDPAAAGRWMVAQRGGPSAARRAGQQYQSAQQQRSALRAGSIIRSGFNPTWTSIGPSPLVSGFFDPSNGAASGRIDSIVLNGSNSSLVVGTADGGVWSTTNTGTSWSTTTDQAASLVISSLAVSGSTIYAATGDDTHGIESFYGEGVLKSTDGGATWTQLNPSGMFSGLHTSAIGIDPNNASHILLAAENGIYSSTDGGTTWGGPVGLGTASTPDVTSMVLDGTTSAPSTIVYAADGNTGFVYKSTDGGSTFTHLTSGLPTPTSGSSITALAMAPTNHAVLYASIGDPSLLPNANGGLVGLYKSSNAGATWTKTSAPDYTIQSFYYGGTSNFGQAWYDNTVAVSPSDANTVYAGGIGLAKSTDGGTTWTNVTLPSPQSTINAQLHPDLHALTFDSSGNLFIGGDGGIQELPSGASSLTNRNGNLTTLEFYPGIAQSGNGTNILGGMQDNGSALRGYTGLGSGWGQVNGGDGQEAAIDPLNTAIQYTTANQGLYKTTNSWTSGVDAAPNIAPNFTSSNWVPPLALVANSGSANSPTLYFGGEQVYKSSDGTGTTWTKGTGAHTSSDVSAIAVAPSNSSVVYAGFDDGTLQVSQNAGGSWTTISPAAASGLWITHIAVDSSNAADATITFSGTSFPQFAQSSPHVMQTTNGTAVSPTWTDITGDLPDAPANTAVLDRGSVIVGTDVGVYEATPNGGSTSWTSVGTGLPNVLIHDLLLTSNGTLIAATHGRSMWTTSVVAADGTGTMGVVASPVSVFAGGTFNTLTFTYTADPGGLINGEVDVAVPSGWTAPTTSAGAGNVTSSAGTAGVSGHTIKVSGLTLTGGSTFTITYSTATSNGIPGSNTFTTSEASNNTDTPVALASSPAVTTNPSGDGSGTMAVAPLSVFQASSGNTLTFTYTAATGGTLNGEVDVTVPAGWTAPTTAAGPGHVAASTGTVGVSSTTIQVSALTVASGSSFTITYSGVTAPANSGSTVGSYPFATSEKSTSGGTLTPLPTPFPTVTTPFAADGSGTMDVAPLTALRSSTGTLTFSYTVPTGGMNSGEVDVAVPAGWTAPTLSAGAGHVSASAGTAAVTGSTIQVTGLTQAAADTVAITYASATAPSTAQTSVFNTSMKATSAGTLTALASSPAVAVGNAPDGSGTNTVAPTTALASTSNNMLTFTYTADPGGTTNGEVDVAVPAGWTAPTTSAGAGNVTVSTGTVAISSRTIQVTGVSLAGGATLTVTYSGATAPSTTGASTFTTTEKSSSAGTLTQLAMQPAVTVNNAPDGSGTNTVSPTHELAGSTGDTLTFTYTAATGGMNSGEVDVAVPNGWSAPVAANVTASTGTKAVSGQSIMVTGVTLAANATLTITVSGESAAASAGSSVFTTSEKSTSGGTLTAIASSPAVTLTNAPDGSGTMGVSPNTTSINMVGQSFVFTYKAATGGLQGGEVDMAIPSGWPAPATGVSGNVTASTGTASVTGQTVKVTGVTLTSGATFTITYSPLTTPSVGGTYTFTTSEKSTSGGTVTALASSPTINVSGGSNGVGTVAVAPTTALAGTSTNQFSFTYTAPSSSNLVGAEVDITVPAGWTAPTTSNTSTDTGTISISGTTIKVENVNLTANSSMKVGYGISGHAVTAPTTTGSYTFTTGEAAATGTPTTPLAVQPAVQVDNAGDGSGTMGVSPTSVLANTSSNTLTFTYTPAPGGMTNGEVDLDIPADWTAPTTATGAGHVAASKGTLSLLGNTIKVSALSLNGSTMTITYSGATSPGPTPGSDTFDTMQKSTSGGTLTTLGTSPTVTETTAPDGSGTNTVSPTSVLVATSGNTLTFTYTAASGGMSNGEVDVTVPNGWSAPSLANVTASTGTTSVSGQTITVTGVTLATGSTLTITDASETAPATSGTSTFTTQQKSTSGGTLTSIATQPAVLVKYSPDGSGAMVVNPPSVLAGSGSNSLTFTYTAAAGGINAGEVDLTVPAGWTTPTSAAGAGQVTVSAGTLAVSANTIKVSALTLPAGGTVNITYAGVTAPSTTGTATFTTTENSTSAGTPAAISGQPQVGVVNAPDGSGTLGVSPTSVVAGSVNTMTLTYTAASGGLGGGEVDVTVPLGWSAPTTAAGTGHVSSSTGTVSVSGNTIKVSAVTLAGGAHLTITYAQAEANKAVGTYDFTGAEKSTSGGTLTNLAAPATVDTTNAPDGSGTMTASPANVVVSTVNTVTFTYTAATGGLTNGEVDVTVPAGWTAPTTGAGAGNVTASTGTVGVTGSTVQVTGVTLVGDATMTITYSTATAPAAPTTSTFSAAEASTPGGTVTALASSPQVTVSAATAADGSGTNTVSPTTATASSTNNTLTFTYTAASGGTSNGEVDVTVPSGWTTPTTAAGAGHVSASTGTLAVSSRTVQVTELSIPGGSALTISYSGATAPSSVGTSNFATSEKSTSGGTLTALASSPSVRVQSVPGAPTNVAASAGNGQATVTWSPPANTGGLSITGYTVTANPGGNSVSVGSAARSAVVGGLTNGTMYSFTVTASNSVGRGPASAASNTVIPLFGVGYWLVASDGGIFAFGDAVYHGSMGGTTLNQPIVGIATTGDRQGYWMVAKDGGIFAFGDAAYHGSMGGKHLNQPVVGMAPTSDGGGYWLVAADGGIFAFGDAQFHGSMGGQPLNQPIVAMVPSLDGGGYWMVAKDGGVFAFGDASYLGSLPGSKISDTVAGIAPTHDGGGYWVADTKGKVYTFGDAVFHGDLSSATLNQPVVGISATIDGGGYYMDAPDGGVFAFGDAVYKGSMGGTKLNQPVVGIASL